MCRSWLKTVKSNADGGFERAGSSRKRTESRGMCAPTGVWLLGPLGTVGLQNNVLTLFCSAQSCRSHYTFKPPDRITLGGYDSGGGAAGLQAPNRVDASVLVLLLSAKVPRGGTCPEAGRVPRQDVPQPLGVQQPVRLSISRQSCQTTSSKRVPERDRNPNSCTLAHLRFETSQF